MLDAGMLARKKWKMLPCFNTFSTCVWLEDSGYQKIN
jgi:hypothetical protein